MTEKDFHSCAHVTWDLPTGMSPVRGHNQTQGRCSTSPNSLSLWMEAWPWRKGCHLRPSAPTCCQASMQWCSSWFSQQGFLIARCQNRPPITSVHNNSMGYLSSGLRCSPITWFIAHTRAPYTQFLVHVELWCPHVKEKPVKCSK